MTEGSCLSLISTVHLQPWAPAHEGSLLPSLASKGLAGRTSASPAQLCFPCDPRGDLLKARRKNWASLQIVLCTANCIAVRILILPVCSALVPRITCGILDYLCLNKRLGNLKKKMCARWQEPCPWRSHFLFSFLIPKLLGFGACSSVPVTFGKECVLWQKPGLGNSDFWILFPGAHGSAVTCDTSVKHQGLISLSVKWT